MRKIFEIITKKILRPSGIDTAQKIMFSIKEFLSKCERILNEKLFFLCSVKVKFSIFISAVKHTIYKRYSGSKKVKLLRLIPI